jgi:hypothetical protein
LPALRERADPAFGFFMVVLSDVNDNAMWRASAVQGIDLVGRQQISSVVSYQLGHG